MDVPLDESALLLARFPTYIKLSYETMAHKKVSSDYDMGLAIPFGKRAFIWFTFVHSKHVCCILELNRTNSVGTIQYVPMTIPPQFELGTILLGFLGNEWSDSSSAPTPVAPTPVAPTPVAPTPVAPTPVAPTPVVPFIIDEIYQYKGIFLGDKQPLPFLKKQKYLLDCFQQLHKNSRLSFHFVVSWKAEQHETLPDKWVNNVGYAIRYLQYRNSSTILPHLNVQYQRQFVWNPTISPRLDEKMVDNKMFHCSSNPIVIMPTWNLNFSSPIYRESVVFWVKADIAYDVYHLHVKNSKNNDPLLFQYAFIPDYQTSVFMNSLFRNIKENQNIDYIEESEDEEEFENIYEDKFVDLDKVLLIECTFNWKFKRWIPKRVRESVHVPTIDQFILPSPPVPPFVKQHTQMRQPLQQNKQFYRRR